MPGDGKEKLLGEEGFISLLTWNVYGLPNDLVSVSSWEKRVDQIARKIIACNADIVLLQECFEEGLSKALHEKLKDTYAHSYWHLEAGMLRPSGTPLLSKLPLDQFRFTPHQNLLGRDCSTKMGMIDFILLNKNNVAIAHVAGGHFQGSSSHDWRVGVTKGGDRLSYPEVREQEAKIALDLLLKPTGIPTYLIGDLNVCRRTDAFATSLLNSKVNGDLTDIMTPEMLIRGTNTTFWNHVEGLAAMYPEFSHEEILSMAQRYKKLSREKIEPLLLTDKWQQTLSVFDETFFNEAIPDLTPKEKLLWEYFKKSALSAIEDEKRIWKGYDNPGEAPPIPIGQLVKICALPIEESLDCVLGTNEFSEVRDIQILTGYDDTSEEETLSDHHPVLAFLKVSEAARTVFK